MDLARPVQAMSSFPRCPKRLAKPRYDSPIPRTS